MNVVYNNGIKIINMIYLNYNVVFIANAASRIKYQCVRNITEGPMLIIIPVPRRNLELILLKIKSLNQPQESEEMYMKVMCTKHLTGRDGQQ